MNLENNNEQKQNLKPRNLIWQFFLIFAFTAIFLVIIQFYEIEIDSFGVKIKKIDFFSDITKTLLTVNKLTEKKVVDACSDSKVSNGIDVSSDVDEFLTDNKEINNADIDKAMFDLTVDKNKIIDDFNKYNFESNSIVEFGSGEYHQKIQYFVNQLKEIKKNSNKIRIAYFGDSVIEGDIVVQDLRNSLQNYFSGRNVGFICL